MNNRTIWPVLGVLLLVAGCQTRQGIAQKELDNGIPLCNSGNWEGAIRCFSASIENNSESAEAYFRRSLAYCGQGDYQRAIVDAGTAVRVKPSSPTYRVGRGVAFLCGRQFQAAIADFDEALKLNPSEQLRVTTQRLRAVADKSRQVQGPGEMPLASQAFKPSATTEVPWTAYGWLGRTAFFEAHPVWSIGLYLLGHFVVVSFVSGTYITNVRKPLTQEEQGINVWICLFLGAGLFFLAWGYVHWFWWIACVFATVNHGVAMAQGN